MYFPSLEQFRSLANQGNLIPVYREILADMETPVSAFKKIDDGQNSFLLESIAGGEKWARYSFLGSNPGKIFRCKDEHYEILDRDGSVHSGTSPDPLAQIKKFMEAYRPVQVDGLPPFFGGLVGYLGYDMVRFFEDLPSSASQQIGTDDACFLLTDTLLIFDNVAQTIKVVCNVSLSEDEDPDAAYSQALVAIDRLVEKLRCPLTTIPAEPAYAPAEDFVSDFTADEFMAAVERCKEYVRAGDIIQVVLSQRFSGRLGAPPFDVYRALRTLNPSPYMFFLRFGKTLVIGASPEVLVRKVGAEVEVRPIAGTRPRGGTVDEDLHLEEDLLADPKECAEHIMLVDLGRNDIGRVCRTGSVEVSELMVIERYSHVMHIVSNVHGLLRSDCDVYDVLRATFPAGTLSGAPKIRAMEIIDELEPARREIYGGAVGYFSFSGNMDMAIAIRTLVVHDDRIHLQAGAGIVADSDPAAEYQETLNKARGVMKAIDMARKGWIDMLLMLDNYDSFTYNLVQYFQELGEEVRVFRNDKISVAEIAALQPQRLVVSPGPCSPTEAGVSVSAIQQLAGKIPILGVCLGHQSMAYAFGGRVVRADKLMHGKTSPVYHDHKGLFKGLSCPFDATRYHSLIVERATLPADFEISAWTEADEIMGMRHRKLPMWGVQFHPESILTVEGKRLLRNFLEMT